MIGSYKHASTIIVSLGKYISPDKFEHLFDALKDSWAFTSCQIEGIIYQPDNRVRISYNYESHAGQQLAKEEIMSLVQACGAQVADKGLGF